MILNNIYRAGALLLALQWGGALNAQLHESINVEGKYVPEVIRVDRVNTFPKAVGFALHSTPLEYEWDGVAAAFSPSLLPMPATGWRDTHNFIGNPGYIEFGAGSWLNSTLSAGYRFIDNSSTLVGIRLQHNSTSLWKPNLSEATADEKQYRYDESVGVYASHVVKGVGRIDAAFDYHVGLFNYYGTFNPRPAAGASPELPDQTVNDVSLRIDWKSAVRPASSLNYKATARVRHLAYRSLPLPLDWSQPHAKGNRETNIELAGSVNFPWDNGASMGLDADLNVLAYGGPDVIFSYSMPGKPEETLCRPDNYGVLTLTPYYRFTRGLVDLRIGADIDMSFNAGPEGNRYSFFHIAPDASFAMQSGQFGMFVNISGGSTLNTLANLRQQDYYMMPALTTTRPTYTPLDAALGVNIGPFSGFSVGAEARYRTSKNVPLGGWYQAWLNYGSSPADGMNVQLAGSEKMQYSLNSPGIDIHGCSVAAKLEYTPSPAVTLRAEGSWQPQKGEKGYFNGYDRPRVTARLEGSVVPIAPLRVTLGYDYRGVRNIYTASILPTGVGGVSTSGYAPELHGYRLPDLTLLNMSASWDFSSTFSAWLQADNLLNRHDEMLPLLPTQGVVVTGGIKLLF